MGYVGGTSRGGLRFVRFCQMNKGLSVPPTIVIVGSPAEDALRHDGMWPNDAQFIGFLDEEQRGGED
jgi:hypothetical protein